MPLKLIKRGNWWHIQGTHHGVRIRKATGTAVRSEAEALREKYEREIYSQKVLGQEKAVGFAEAAEAYLEHGEDRYMRKVVEAFLDRPISELRQPDLDRAAKDAYPNAKPSTINRQFYTPAIAVLRFAADQDWCRHRKWKRPKQPEGRTDWRTPEEIEAFIQAAPWHVARNVIIYIGTMMRATEGVELELRDVSQDGRKITLWGESTKGGYTRSIEPLSRAKPLLSELHHAPICTDDQARYHAYDAVNTSIERVCKEHNLAHFSCHVLRHTGATWRYALDPDLPRLQAYGGWKSLAMVQRYVHAATPDLPERLERHGWTL